MAIKLRHLHLVMVDDSLSETEPAIPRPSIGEDLFGLGKPCGLIGFFSECHMLRRSGGC